jgi:DNA-binding GntR family transcriptional regulator
MLKREEAVVGVNGAADPEERGSTQTAQTTQGLEVELRRRIARQIVPPGALLRENEIAEEFDVSRAQVREAFIALALRGLIERVPNKGALVRRFDFDEIVEIFTVREPLEGMAARLAAQNTQSADWLPFVEAFDHAMPAYVRDGDFEAFADHYQAFRERIIEAANNRTLSDMLDSISEKISVLTRRIIILPGRGELAVKEHRAVLDALVRGDAEAAERLRKENMRSGLAWFIRYKTFIL